MIHFIQPFSYDLNIGKAYNDAIDLLPDNDWICITDHDTLKFSGFANHIKEIILSVSKDVIFTSRVNRLAKSNPAVIEALYDCEDIDEHKDMASFLWEQNKTLLTDTNIIAGCCMVFHKSLWRDVGGFLEKSITFDKHFSKVAKQKGKKLKIAQGLYVFHLYRWGHENPATEIAHLIKK